LKKILSVKLIFIAKIKEMFGESTVTIFNKSKLVVGNHFISLMEWMFTGIGLRG